MSVIRASRRSTLAAHPEPQPRGARISGRSNGRSTRQRRPSDSSPRRGMKSCMTSGCGTLRQKRDGEMHGIPEWEELRALASAIKEHTLTHLDEYLEQFEANAKANGVVVHWARTPPSTTGSCTDPDATHGAKTLIKSKSMLTEECGFRELHDATLASRWSRPISASASSSSTMRTRAMSSCRPCTSCAATSPRFSPRRSAPIRATRIAHYLAEAQREATRPLILKADAGMTGCNFAVAETGCVVVCTNEGNADLCGQCAEAAHRLRSASRSSFRGSSISPCSSGCCRAARSARRLRNTPRISAGPARAARCMSCWSITAARSGWAWRSSGPR